MCWHGNCYIQINKFKSISNAALSKRCKNKQKNGIFFTHKNLKHQNIRIFPRLSFQIAYLKVKMFSKCVNLVPEMTILLFCCRQFLCIVDGQSKENNFGGLV